jgi:hypothetical protein
MKKIKTYLFKTFILCSVLFSVITSCGTSYRPNESSSRLKSNENSSCLNQQNENLEQNISEKIIPDTVVRILEEENYRVFDTIINTVSISFKLSKDTGYTIKTKMYKKGIVDVEKYPNTKVYLLIKSDTNVIYERYLTKYDFKSIITSDFFKEQLFMGVSFESYQDGIFIFHAYTSIPDTDIGYTIAVSISEDGKMKLSEVDEEWEEW